MQMLKKLFNSDKKFYLELDEIKESEVVQTAVKTASKAADVVKETASDVASSQPVQQAVTKAKDILDDEQDTAEVKSDKAEAKSQPKQVKAEPEAKSKQNQKAQAKPEAKSKQNGKQADTQETEKSAPTLENSGASSFDPPFWVAAMYNNNDSNKDSNGRVAEETFATDNLMPIITKYRRRPGGSLNKFKDMAKQAKTPKG